MAKRTHPFSDYTPGDLPFYRAIVDTTEGPRFLVGVVPGYVGDQCVLFMADGTFVLMSPHSLFPLKEEELHEHVDMEWLVPTKALKGRDLDRAFRLEETISRQEIEDRLSRIYSVLKARTFGLGELKIDIQTNDDSPYECEFVMGPFGLVLTDSPAGMTWMVVHHPDANTEQPVASYPWEGHWDAAQAFFKQVGHYAIHRAIEDYGYDVMQAEGNLGESTPFDQIPRKEG